MSSYDGPVGKAEVVSKTRGKFSGEIVFSDYRIVVVRWEKHEFIGGEFTATLTDTLLPWHEIVSIDQAVKINSDERRRQEAESQESLRVGEDCNA